MQHLDVAGGTGDVAFRVLRKMREDELRLHEEAGSSNEVEELPGEVTVCDINPDMLGQGQKRAAQMTDLGACAKISGMQSIAPMPQCDRIASLHASQLCFTSGQNCNDIL